MADDPTRPLPRFWWFADGEIHFDAQRYARLRGISLDDAVAELRELAAEVMPSTPVTVKD
jgi:hypothetical protein